jgi:hypothetical protein
MSQTRGQFSQLAGHEHDVLIHVCHWELDDDTVPADAEKDTAIQLYVMISSMSRCVL